MFEDVDGALEERDGLDDGCEQLENTESECIGTGARSEATGGSRRGSDSAVHGGSAGCSMSEDFEMPTSVVNPTVGRRQQQRSSMEREGAWARRYKKATL
jgi:hypothetical protein